MLNRRYLSLGFPQSHSETDYLVWKMIPENFIKIWEHGAGGEKPVWCIAELVITAGSRG